MRRNSKAITTEGTRGHRVFLRALPHSIFSALVLISRAVLLFANLAVGLRQGVVYAVVHRRERSEIGKDRLQIVVGKIFDLDKGHDRIQLASADISGTHSADEGAFVVVTNA